MNISICCDCRTDIDAYRRCVNQFYLFKSVCFNGYDMFRKLFPFMAASSAGIRLSRIKVVLPEPDTPVTAVILPLGILTASGWTVWIFRVASLMIPLSNICLRAGREVRRSLAFPERNGAIMELGFSLYQRLFLRLQFSLRRLLPVVPVQSASPRQTKSVFRGRLI